MRVRRLFLWEAYIEQCVCYPTVPMGRWGLRQENPLKLMSQQRRDPQTRWKLNTDTLSTHEPWHMCPNIQAYWHIIYTHVHTYMHKKDLNKRVTL